MDTLKNKTQKGFTTVTNNIFRDKRLNFRDVGLLIFLLSLPDNWKFSISGIASVRLEDGKYSIRSGIEKIEKCGYLTRRPKKGENGRYTGYEWEVFNSPIAPLSGFQTTEKPTMEKRSSENQTEQNTNKQNTNKQNTYNYNKRNGFNDFPQREIEDMGLLENVLLSSPVDVERV